jgi:glucose-specific phosphotransferase system IIA component
VPDEVFAQRLVGDGVAVRPSAGEVVAPVAGRVAKLFPGGHGLVVETISGLQVLVHLGIDTVRLGGRGFTTRVAEGQDVRAGEPLVAIDVAALTAEGVELVSPVVVISGHPVAPLAAGSVRAGDPLLAVQPLES